MTWPANGLAECVIGGDQRQDPALFLTVHVEDVCVAASLHCASGAARVSSSWVMQFITERT